MNENTATETDRYFVAMANERIAHMDLAGARRLAREAAASRPGSSRGRRVPRLHLGRVGRDR